MTYYNIKIHKTENNTYEFAVGGWIHEVATLEEAKKEIKEWL